MVRLYFKVAAILLRGRASNSWNSWARIVLLYRWRKADSAAIFHVLKLCRLKARKSH